MDFANVALTFGFEMLIDLTENGALTYRLNLREWGRRGALVNLN